MQFRNGTKLFLDYKEQKDLSLINNISNDFSCDLVSVEIFLIFLIFKH